MATGSSVPKTLPKAMECAVSIVTVRVCTDKACGRSDRQHVSRVHHSNVLPESAAYVPHMPCHGCSGAASACSKQVVVAATIHCERIDNSVTRARTSPHFAVGRHIKSHGHVVHLPLGACTYELSRYSGLYSSVSVGFTLDGWLFWCLHRRRSIALGGTSEVSRTHPLGGRFGSHACEEALWSRFPRACTSAPSSDMAACAGCRPPSMSPPQSCKSSAVPVPAVALRPLCGSARWPIAVPVPSIEIVHAARRSVRGSCAVFSAVCCVPIAWPMLRPISRGVPSELHWRLGSRWWYSCHKWALFVGHW